MGTLLRAAVMLVTRYRQTLYTLCGKLVTLKRYGSLVVGLIMHHWLTFYKIIIRVCVGFSLLGSQLITGALLVFSCRELLLPCIGVRQYLPYFCVYTLYVDWAFRISFMVFRPEGRWGHTFGSLASRVQAFISKFFFFILLLGHVVFYYPQITTATVSLVCARLVLGALVSVDCILSFGGALFTK